MHQDDVPAHAAEKLRDLASNGGKNPGEETMIYTHNYAPMASIARDGPFPP
jgi:hypothetical protein